MSNSIYPFQLDARCLAYTVTRSMAYDTEIQSSPTKVEFRLSQQYNPIWKYILIYELLKDIPNDLIPGLVDTDLRTLVGFYGRMSGQFDDFLFDDPDDNSVGPGLLPDGSPNLQAQLQTFQDVPSGNWFTPIQRIYGGFYEDITDLQPGGITVFANGVLAAGSGIDYTIIGPGVSIVTSTGGMSFEGLVLQWTHPPSTPVTAQFNYFFRLRFDMDSIDFEKFVNRMWTIGGSESKNGSGQIKLVTARTV